MLNRSIKPIPSGNIKFIQPEIDIFSLQNSLKVYHSFKNSLPIIQMNILIPSGSVYNEKGKEGLSMLTSILLDEGAGGLSSFEISDKLELLGSILNITSNKEYTTISLMCLKDKFVDSLEILSKIILQPTFSEEDFERQKSKLLTKNIQLEDDPAYMASNLFNRNIFENSPFQFPSSGINDTINAITNSDVKNFYENRYFPNGTFIVLVGNLQIGETKSVLNDFFGLWTTKENKNISISISPTKMKIILYNKPDAAQTELRIGHFSKGRNTKDFYAKSLLNSILGGQFSSRINLNLREDKGFTYGAHSNFNYNSVGGTFAVSTSVKSENTFEAISEILFELSNIRETISQEEIDFSKSYIIRRYPSLFETYSNIASNITLLPIFNLEQYYFSNYIDNIRNTTYDEIKTAAEENIDLNNLLVVAVGDKTKIEEQLNKLTNYEVDIIEKL